MSGSRAGRVMVVVMVFVLLAGVVLILTLQRLAAGEGERRRDVERAAVAGYRARYGTAGVAADASRLFSGCAVVDLYVPDVQRRPVSVVVTRTGGTWGVARSEREGEYFDADDVASGRRSRPVTCSPSALLNGPFRFGRVIAAYLGGPAPHSHLLYIYRAEMANPTQPPLKSLVPEDLLIPPMFANGQGWLRGYFQTVLNRPIGQLNDNRII